VVISKGKIVPIRLNQCQGATQSVIPTLVKDVVARFVGVIFEPEQEAFFELATERLPDRGHQAQLEAGNPPRNGATRNFE
jgi:hypothetical protein